MVWWPDDSVDRSVKTLDRPDMAFVTNHEKAHSLNVGDVAFFTGEYEDGLAHNQPELTRADPPRAVLQIRREPFM
jgi:hypothetical protein